MGIPFLTIPFLTQIQLNWGQFWVNSGSIRGRFGIVLGSIWGRIGIDLGSVWDQFGVNWGSVRVGFGVDLSNFWENLGHLQKLCQERYCQERWPHIWILE